METKTCSGCGEIKRLGEFPKHPRCTDGHEGRCKECRNAYSREYRTNNPDKAKSYSQTRSLEQRMLYRETARPKEALRRQQPKYKEKHKQRARQFHAENPEIKKAQDEVWKRVRSGKMPRAASLQCEHCGAQAASYHHHLGYEPGHWFDVIPLCLSCHSIAHVDAKK